MHTALADELVYSETLKCFPAFICYLTIRWNMPFITYFLLVPAEQINQRSELYLVSGKKMLAKHFPLIQQTLLV